MLSKVAEFVQKRNDPFGIREQESEIPYEKSVNLFDKIEEKK